MSPLPPRPRALRRRAAWALAVGVTLVAGMAAPPALASPTELPTQTATAAPVAEPTAITAPVSEPTAAAAPVPETAAPGPIATPTISAAPAPTTASPLATTAVAEAATISGRVTGAGYGVNPGGEPVPGISVIASDAAGVQKGGALTDADGHYTIALREAGSMRVDFIPPFGSVYLEQWWNGETTLTNSTPVAVAAGQQVGSVDAALSRVASISGVVTGSGGMPLVDSIVRVTVGETTLSDTTDSSGAWLVSGLPAGLATVRFDSPPALSYLTEWWTDKPDAASATKIEMTNGYLFEGIDAQLDLGASIVGSLRGEGAPGVGLGGVDIVVYNADNEIVTTAWKRGDGTFSTVGLPAGSYHVRFEPDRDFQDEWWKDAIDFATSTPIVLGDSGVSVPIDAVLGPFSTISGTVTNAQGVGVPFVKLTAINAHRRYYNTAVTSATGAYSIPNLVAGEYHLSIDPEEESGNYLDEYWNDKSTYDSGDLLGLLPGVAVTRADVVLTAGATISGVVESAGGPLAGVEVSAYNSEGVSVSYTSTSSTGAYSLTRLPAGSYSVSFSPSDSQNLVGEWWNDKATRDSATKVAVTVGQTVTIGTTQLAPGGSIAGTVTVGIPGVPAPDALVSVYTSDGRYISGMFTAADGTYLVKSLPAGSYKVQYTRSGYLPVWSGGKTTLATADSIVVPAGGAVVRQDADLSLGGSVSGTVASTTATGSPPVRRPSVVAYDASGTPAPAVTDASGNFVVAGLQSGTYRLYGTAPGFEGTWFDDPATPAAVDPITVTVGVASTGKGLVMRPTPTGASISATIKDTTSKGLAAVQVTAHRSDGSTAATAFTNPNGLFTVAGLAPGSYRLKYAQASAPDGTAGYATQWSGNKPTLALATAVNVTLDQRRTINTVVLARGARIAGIVTAAEASTKKLAGLRVEAIRDGVDTQYAVTDSTGRYVIGRLPAGSYKLRFSDTAPPSATSRVTRWWTGQTTPAAAKAVPVSAGQYVGGKDVALTRVGTTTPRGSGPQ
jgi:hypothetical protein